MFDELSYLGYTLLFCVPPLLLLWLRKEFFLVMRKDLSRIFLSTVALTAYGSLIWPIAIHYGAWTYGPEKITGIKLFDYVHLEDVLWWFLVALLFSSYVSLSTRYEDIGEDVLSREIAGLLESFRNAFRGLGVVALERNSTVHVAVATFVLIEAVLFRISAVEWLFVVVVIGSVVGFELLNSAVERLASRVTTEADEQVRFIKDVAAAGVLVSAMAAAVVGLVILLSRVLSHLKV